MIRIGKRTRLSILLYAQLKEIRSAGCGTDTPNGQFPADLVTGGEGRAREEAIFLRSLPRQHLVRANDCQAEGRLVLLGRAFRLPSLAFCQHHPGEPLQGSGQEEKERQKCFNR